MRRFGRFILVLECLCLGTALPATEALAEDRSPAESDAVVAIVGDQPVYASEVTRLLNQSTGGREVDPAVLPVLQAEILANVVNRRLVLAYARSRQSGAHPEQIEAALAELKSRLAAQGQSIDTYLSSQSLREADLRRQIAWDLTWRKYLTRYLSEKRLKAHFDDHRRQFDGTRLAVSHILLRPETPGDPNALAESVERARAIRQEILSGRISFAEAARRHSAGPSARDGGKLGLIGRRGPMVETFSRAAFALQPRQVSLPVTTRFGVHLIRCDAVRPGSKDWQEARELLEKALAGELMDRLARFQRRFTPVEFTGKWPYFKHGTRQLVAKAED